MIKSYIRDKLHAFRPSNAALAHEIMTALPQVFENIARDKLRVRGEDITDAKLGRRDKMNEVLKKPKHPEEMSFAVNLSQADIDVLHEKRITLTLLRERKFMQAHSHILYADAVIDAARKYKPRTEGRGG